MSSYERDTESEGCTGWCNKQCSHGQGADPAGSSQMRLDRGQDKPENSDAREIMDLESQGNAKKALQDKKARPSDMKLHWNRKPKSTKQSDAMVAKLRQRSQEEKANASRMEGADRRQKQGAKRLEVEVARLREETEALRRKEKEHEAKVAGISQHLRQETEASRQKDKEVKRLEGKAAGIGQRLREETEVCRQKDKEVKHLRAKVTELTGASRRKDRDMEQMEAQKAKIERQLREQTLKLSELEAVARQNSTKENKHLKTTIAELKLCLQEERVKRSNIEASWANSQRLEGKVVELEAKLSDAKDDARRWEQNGRDLSAKDQRQCDEINQLKARIKTLEQANKSPLQVLDCKPDSISMGEVNRLVRTLNTQIEQLSIRVMESPGSGAGSAALNDFRDCLGPWLFDALRNRSNESNPLIPQIALQAVLVHACSRIINHWNPPFWDDSSMCFRVYDNMEGVGPISAGTWSALRRTMSQSEIQAANIKYLSEIVAKVIATVGGPLPDGKSEYQDDVEDITKMALELRQIVSKEVKSKGLVTYTVPPDTQFNPSEMNDTEGNADETEHVVCTIEMGLQYRKRAELGKPGGGECGVTLKPKVVLPVALEA